MKSVIVNRIIKTSAMNHNRAKIYTSNVKRRLERANNAKIISRVSNFSDEKTQIEKQQGIRKYRGKINLECSLDKMRED